MSPPRASKASTSKAAADVPKAKVGVKTKFTCADPDCDSQCAASTSQPACVTHILAGLLEKHCPVEYAAASKALLHFALNSVSKVEVQQALDALTTAYKLATGWKVCFSCTAHLITASQR